ncbi:MAG TPA: glycoside hydrolase family 5 protein, partial [Polyangia bacterium]
SSRAQIGGFPSPSCPHVPLAILIGVLGAACSSPGKGASSPGAATGGSWSSGGKTTTSSGGAGSMGGMGGMSGSGGTGGNAGSGGPGTGGSSGGGGNGAGGSTLLGDAAADSAAVRPDLGDAMIQDAAVADIAVDRPAKSDTVGPGPDGSGTTGFLPVEGSKLVDSKGMSVRLTGVNWFGFETSNQSPHGTWARDYRSMLKQIRDVGFNSVRLPWSNAIMRANAAAQSVNTYGKDPYDGTDPMNADLKGKTPMEMLDLVVAAAGDIGLKLILDDHSRDPDGYDKEEVWYTTSTSEAQWIADWVSMAKRYAGNPTVVAMDLDNEPHGKASWGKGDATTDWNTAAEKCGNAILEVNPDVLIVVEGVSIVGTDSYWWGGNLSAAKAIPIKLSRPEKLVYSAHDYGPQVHEQTWFTDATFPANLSSVWDKHFDFLMSQGLGHVLLGEFGIGDRTYQSGAEGKWFDTLLAKLGGSYSWTFWCWNPNSGDTGGLLESSDWVTTVQWKLDALKPYLAPMFEK